MGTGRTRRTGRRRLAIGVIVAAGLLVAACVPTLGGPDNRFGNDPTRAGTQPGLWAAIGGPYANRADGDPFASKCAIGPSSATACDGSGANATYDQTGYLWGIEVPKQGVGVPVTVAVYDPADAPNSALTEPAAQFAPFATSFTLFNTSGSNQDINVNPANSLATLGRCSSGPGSRVFAAGSTEGENAWYTLCTFTPTLAGVYPLQVKSSAIPGVVDSGDGWNNFSIRATTNVGVQPIVTAIGRASVTFDPATSGGTSRSYLTQLSSYAAGRVALIDFFDPGDGTAGTLPFTLQIMGPPSSGAPGPVPIDGTPVACTYNAAKSLYQGSGTPDSSSTCTITTTAAASSTSNYNGGWLRIRIHVPTTYTCSTNCWWSIVDRTGTGDSHDRVVWTMSVSQDVVTGP